MNIDNSLRRPIISRSSADRKSLQLSARYVLMYSVTASVGQQNCIYRPIKMQNYCRPIVCINVIAALGHHENMSV